MLRPRFEKKYWIDETQATSVRNFLGSYLEPDEHESIEGLRNYPVHSIYLDSDDLFTYWSTVNGDRNRFKLRLRFYHTDPEAPVFCEVKRRQNKCIDKQRAAVRQEAVALLMQGIMPDPETLISRGARQSEALALFVELVSKLTARPKVLVSYQREAWVSPANPGVRVTLDRHVQAQAIAEPRFDGILRDPRGLFGDKVVLELKFADRFPAWLKQMVETFNLVQGDSPKYCRALEVLGIELRPRIPAGAA